MLNYSLSILLIFTITACKERKLKQVVNEPHELLINSEYLKKINTDKRTYPTTETKELKNKNLLNSLLKNYQEKNSYSPIKIKYPLNHTIYPRDFRSPVLIWEQNNAQEKNWLLIVECNPSKEKFYFVTNTNKVILANKTWEKIKGQSINKKTIVTILAFNQTKTKIISKGQVIISTSPDELKAPIMYREVPIPIIYAQYHLKQVSMRLADLSKNAPPKFLMKNKNVCYSCHSVSNDGSSLSLVMQPLLKTKDNAYTLQFLAASNRENNKFTINSTNALFFDSSLNEKQISTLYKEPQHPFSGQQFQNLSPDGKNIISVFGKQFDNFYSFKDKSYSFFFIFKGGIIGSYSLKTKKISLIPENGNNNYIHTNPSWSSDGKYVIYARAKKASSYFSRAPSSTNFSTNIEDSRKQFSNLPKFDLYRIPFNNGNWGKSKPLKGASLNGANNYFAKSSPNGKWIVFNKSKLGVTFIQPDSELFIIPAKGGKARKLKSNFTGTMNSWHSWSPNSKWLVFTSKVNSPYTELFLTRIDDKGNDSPPILLENLSDKNKAINLPEFINISTEKLNAIDIKQTGFNIANQAIKICSKCHKENANIFDTKKQSEEKKSRLLQFFKQTTHGLSFEDFFKKRTQDVSLSK